MSSMREGCSNAKPFVYRVEPEKTLNVALRQGVKRNEDYLKRFEALDAEMDKRSLYQRTKALKPGWAPRGNRGQLYRKIGLTSRS